MAMQNVSCKCCGQPDPIYIGKIPDGIIFSGNVLSMPIPGENLYKCPNCFLKFRYPQIDKSILNDLYRSGNLDNWDSTSNKRTDWDIAIQFIESNVVISDSVLDVGCFTGEFLSRLKGYRRLYGIEINEKAADCAAKKGITVIGKDFTSILKGNLKFDVITAFDVIEHSDNPRLFLADLIGLLNDGGYLIIATGNSNALSWRLYGAKYWYCIISEHLSFICEDWCKWVGRELRLSIVYSRKYSHTSRSIKLFLKELFSNGLYLLSPKFFRYLRKIGLGNPDLRKHDVLLETPPAWSTAKDHLICVFQNKND